MIALVVLPRTRVHYRIRKGDEVDAASDVKTCSQNVTVKSGSVYYFCLFSPQLNFKDVRSHETF